MRIWINVLLAAALLQAAGNYDHPAVRHSAHTPTIGKCAKRAENPNVERLYWAVFSRPPSAAEVKAGEDFLKKDAGPDALGDMLWAMFASPGFAYVM